MNNKTLGRIALLCAPVMMLGVYTEETNAAFRDNWFTGIWGLLHITPWMGNIVALQRLKATGHTRFGKRILQAILASLTLANISNLFWLLVESPRQLPFFFYLDLFWPFSNVLMLVAGITIARAGVLPGWKRYVPLFVGCWLPFAFAMLGIFGRTPVALFLGSLYSMVAWSALALLVMRSNGEDTAQHLPAHRFA